MLLAVTSLLTLVTSQQPPPNYSYEALPETSFSCEGRVVGGYYADVEAGCQMFHVCGTSQVTAGRVGGRESRGRSGHAATDRPTDRPTDQTATPGPDDQTATPGPDDQTATPRPDDQTATRRPDERDGHRRTN